MTHFTVDELGDQTFTHAGWTITVGSDWISVVGPCADHVVWVDTAGLWVRGADTYAHAEHPESFTIPWAVIAAIIEARAIRG